MNGESIRLSVPMKHFHSFNKESRYQNEQKARISHQMSKLSQLVPRKRFSGKTVSDSPMKRARSSIGDESSTNPKTKNLKNLLRILEGHASSAVLEGKKLSSKRRLTSSHSSPSLSTQTLRDQKNHEQGWRIGTRENQKNHYHKSEHQRANNSRYHLHGTNGNLISVGVRPTPHTPANEASTPNGTKEKMELGNEAEPVPKSSMVNGKQDSTSGDDEIEASRESSASVSALEMCVQREDNTCPSCQKRFQAKQGLIQHLRTNVQCYITAFKTKK